MKELLSFLLFNVCLLRAAGQSSEATDSAYKCVTISAQDLYSMIRTGEAVKLIDVRMPAEFRPERIGGAVNIPVSKISEKKTRKIGKDTIIIMYCVSGVRSCRAVLKMHDLGFENIYSLDGGIREWKNEGLPVVKKRQKKIK